MGHDLTPLLVVEVLKDKGMLSLPESPKLPSCGRCVVKKDIKRWDVNSELQSGSSTTNSGWLGGVNKLATVPSMQQGLLRNSGRVHELSNGNTELPPELTVPVKGRVHWRSYKSQLVKYDENEEWRVREEGRALKIDHTPNEAKGVGCTVDIYYFTFPVFSIYLTLVWCRVCLYASWQGYSVYLHRQSDHLPICEMTVCVCW